MPGSVTFSSIAWLLTSLRLGERGPEGAVSSNRSDVLHIVLQVIISFDTYDDAQRTNFLNTAIFRSKIVFAGGIEERTATYPTYVLFFA